MNPNRSKKKHKAAEEKKPVVSIEEAFSVELPKTDPEWHELSKYKKIDFNDISAEGGQPAVIEALKKTKKVVLHRDDSPIVSAKKIMEYYPELRREVIEGLLREGEIMNIVGPPKSNKSWSSLNIACNVLSGGLFLGKFQCQRGKVLIVDNELHEETISWRIKAVANALNIPLSRAGNLLDYWPLRGELQDIEGIGDILEKIRPKEYKIVILDALYKFYPEGFDENDNACMARLYNKLDYYARLLDSAIIVIHHSAKGTNAGKSVTDIGAGAGTLTRACDSHLVFREHEDKGVFVIDAANRSFAPIVQFCVEFKFPVWQLNTTADPAKIRGAETNERKPRGDGKPYAKDAIAASGMQKVVDDLRDKEYDAVLSKATRAMTVKEFTELGVGTLTNWNTDICRRQIKRLVEKGHMRQTANSKGTSGAMYVYCAPPVAATAPNTENTPNSTASTENGAVSGSSETMEWLERENFGALDVPPSNETDYGPPDLCENRDAS